MNHEILDNRMVDHAEGVVSTLYLCFKPVSDEIDPLCFEYFFEAGMMNREIYKIAQEGARNHGLLNVASRDFLNMRLVVPALEEQRRIATVLQLVDRELTGWNRKLAHYRQQKKGLMQQLLTGKVRVKVDAETVTV